MLLSIESFVCRRSPDQRRARYFQERARLLQLTRPGASDEFKRRLVAEGPRCSPEDEAYMGARPVVPGTLRANPKAMAALARIKETAAAETERLSAGMQPAAALDS